MEPRDASIDLLARQRARRKIFERTLRVADERLRYIVALFNFDKRNKPYVAACAVKVVLHSQRFLLTAAHVVDALNAEDLWYSDGTSWSNITGESVRTDPPSGKFREHDYLDAAVIN